MKEILNNPVFELIEKTADELNVESYVIGGYVRDYLLKRHSTDIDILVIGEGITLAKKFAEKINRKNKLTVYKNFQTAFIHWDGWDIEFVGARKESYRSNSRKPIVEDGSLEDDQKRRDFTINALAVGLNSDIKGKFIDPFNGITDLNAKIIRTPLDPIKTYSDDPLRMMRAVRFAAQLNFDIHEDSFEAIKKMAHRIKIVSIERITDELNKIIASNNPSKGIELLRTSGLLKHFFKELDDLNGVEVKDGKAHKDNFQHTLQVLENIAEKTDNLWLRWAVLLHDIAKPATKKWDEKNGWTFHGHEHLGAKMVKKIFKKLKLPLNEKMEYVQKLVLLHLRPIALVTNQVTDSAIRRLLFDAGDDIDDLMLLCQADITSKNLEKVKKYLKNFKKVQKKLKEIEEKDRLRNWQPPVTGNDIMEAFNLPPCKEVGLIKSAIREAILDGIIPNNRKKAMDFMLKEGKKMGLESVPYNVNKKAGYKKNKN